MFKSDLLDIGTIQENGKATVQWEILGNPDDIIHWEVDCGCTANIRKEGKFFIAEFTESDAANLTMQQKKDWFPSGKMPLTKGIMTYLRSDNDLYIIVNGQQIINPDVPRQKVTFIGEVELNKGVTVSAAVEPIKGLEVE